MPLSRMAGPRHSERPLRTWIVAVPETAGSALYGMLDVLSAAGNIWQTLTGTESTRKLFDVRIVSPSRAAFRCGNASQHPLSPRKVGSS